METLAGRLSALMKEKGLDGRALARRAGLKSETHIGLILRGTVTRPSAQTLRPIAAVLGVTLEYLLEGGERTVAPPRRYPNLEVVLENATAGAKTWSAEAIAAARSYNLDADEDPTEAWWSDELDRLTQGIKLARQPLPPKLVERGPDVDAAFERPRKPKR